MFAACSEDTRSEVGGVLGASKLSFVGGGGSPGTSVSGGIEVAVMGGSIGASWLGVARGA